MGIWSSIKKAVKAVVRVAVKVITTFFTTIVSMYDLLFGFLSWPPKNFTLHVIILSRWDPNKQAYIRLCSKAAVQPSIDTLKAVLKDKLNINLRPYGSEYIEFYEAEVPEGALKPSCCGADHLGQEFTTPGDFYAQHTAGWVGSIPISLRFPVTVFIVDDVQCKNGCSNGPLADYVVIDLDGLNSTGSLLANGLMLHEIGHACGLLFHNGSTGNVMYKNADNRGPDLNWAQRNFFRSSRHVTYW